MTDELGAVLESQARMRMALTLIAGGGCESFVGPRTCRSEGSGRIKGSPYGAYAWCPPCIAADALDGRPSPKPAGRVLKVIWADDAVDAALARLIGIRDAVAPVPVLQPGEQALMVAIDALRATRGDDDPV